MSAAATASMGNQAVFPESEQHIDIDVEALLSAHVDCLLQLKDRSLKEAYSHFHTSTDIATTSVGLLLFILAFSLSLVGLNSGRWADPAPADLMVLTAVLVINITVWVLFVEQRLRKCRSRLLGYALVFLLLEGLACFRLAAASQAGLLPVPWNTMLLCMLPPMVFPLVAGGALSAVSRLLWLSSIAAILTALTLQQVTSAADILPFITYILASGMILRESQRMSYFLFFTQRRMQEVLREREKAAEEANASELRHMIANVAHDLKTPLSSFLSGVECVSQVIGDINAKLLLHAVSVVDMEDCIQTVSHCMTNMRNTNSFMLMTINRCIDYTKASKGVKLVPKLETIDLLETLALPLNCMKDIQQRVSIALEAIPKGICSHVITDKQWLQENVLCLLSNAVKYSSDGLVTITVHRVVVGRKCSKPSCLQPALPAELKEDEFLRIELEDHGIGLSDEAMASLFSPFKQAQRLAGGTGLGLFSLYKRIEALEGACGVLRRRDGEEGSLFWFEIPYRPDRVAAKMIQPKQRKRSGTNSLYIEAIRNSAKYDQLISISISRDNSAEDLAHHVDEQQDVIEVLLVDDSPAILKMTSMMLRRHKHTVTTATNGAEALKRVIERVESHGRGFDVILMDLQMPIMDGLEATRRLRGMEANGRWKASSGSMALARISSNNQMLPGHSIIIGVSANSDEETAQQAKVAGVDSFMTKPFSLEHFYRTYDAIVAGQSGKSDGIEVINAYSI